MKNIFGPVNLNRLALKNRLVRFATWEGVAAPSLHFPEGGGKVSALDVATRRGTVLNGELFSAGGAYDAAALAGPL